MTLGRIVPDSSYVCTCHVRFPNCSIHGYPAHPESGTRGLDADLEAAWGIIANAGGGDWSKETPEWVESAERWRDRYHARLSASPDLSIDREGGYEPIAEPMVRAMMDVLAARGPFFHALLDEHPDRFVPILADAALVALRGTTQPEPTK